MVDFITKNNQVRPIIRSPIAPPSLTVRELLPKGELTQQEKTAEKDRRSKFAQKRKEESKKKEETKKEEEVSKKKKLLLGSVKVGRKLGRLTRFGAETIQQRRIERSIEQRENIDRLDRQIDDIIDDPNSSDARKFRLLVRLASIPENKRFLTNEQRRFIDRTNRELASRIAEERKASPSAIAVGGGVGSGITPEQFEKLPQDVKDEIVQAV